MSTAPTNLPRTAIEDLAGNFAAKVGYQPAQPLDKIVERLGGEILVQSSLKDGEIQVKEDGTFRIYLSPFTGRLRDRFTVAHELGHYVLHAKLGSEPLTIARSASSGLAGKVESEANVFAAALLMPAGPFLHAVKTLATDGAIAAHFDVSPDAVRVRKQALGLRPGS